MAALRSRCSRAVAAPVHARVLVVHATSATRVRVVNLIRAFLGSTSIAIRRRNLDAAAFVIYQSVRATMLARLLEAPPQIDDETLIEELTDLVLRYLVEDGARVEGTG